MNKAQAIKRLGALLGKRFAYRYDETALVGEDRERARKAREAARKARDEAKAAMEARRAELLRDPEYQRLFSEYRAADAAADKLQSTLLQHRVTVGTSESIFFRVIAQADNWDEAVAKVEQAKAS